MLQFVICKLLTTMPVYVTLYSSFKDREENEGFSAQTQKWEGCK